MEVFSPASQAMLPALLPGQVWHLVLRLPARGVWVWAQREGWHSLWWCVQNRRSVQDIWPEYREEKETGSMWKESVPTGQARGDTSAHCYSLGRAILATAHSILGSRTLGVSRQGLLMDLLGVDGFNGWRKSAFIFFFFGSCCKWNFMHFSGCYCLSELFRCWRTLVSSIMDLFSNQQRHLLQWHIMAHFHL